MYLLDTNVISELRKPKPHGAVLAWYRAQEFDRLFLSAISFYEMQAGIELTREQDPRKADELEWWLNGLASKYRVAQFDHPSAMLTARLMHKQSTPLLQDAMIAAIAKVNGLTVATRNTRDFERFAVPLVNPFLYPKG
jgi:hypothetical protein